MLHEIGKKFSKVITVEDGCIQGGMGSSVLEFFNKQGYKTSVEMLGIPDEIVEHGKPEELHRICNYDTQGIVRTVQKILATQEIFEKA